MLRAAALLAFLAISGCSGAQTIDDEPKSLAETSPEADLTAPGMIPLECESLLQQSQSWGYLPGERWRAESDERALEVADFFGAYSLVPENSARYYRSWLGSPAPATDDDAQKRMDSLTRAQSCDPSLAVAFLDGVIDHVWRDSTKRRAAGNSILRFLVNQQARTAPLLARAVSLHVAERAKAKKYLSGSPGPVRALRARLEKERSTMVAALGESPSPLLMEKNSREEFRLSELMRDQLSRHLPLP